MLVGFRQGLVRAPANFLMKNGTAVSLQVPPSDIVIVTIADGNSNYLISEKHTIVNAWTGPYASNTNYWLYWDIHLVTGERTFGHTLMEPLEGPTPPANAKDGQHWFDTTSNQMKVYIYAVKRWQRVIRVFAAKLAQGGVFVSMSRQSPSFVGTQVGLNIPTSSGALIYDNLGGVLKKKDGTYFTTEDYALTGIAYSSQVKYASVQIRAEADAYMPPLTLVRFTDFNVVRPASNHVVDKVTYGIIETEANVGDIVNVTMDGVIRSAMWDWTSAGINAPIFVDGYGALTNVPSIPPIPVAVVVDKDAILLRPSSLTNGLADEASARAAGDALKVSKAGDTLTGTLTFTNGATITGVVNPVAATDVANKQYVDALAAGLSWQEPVESIGAGLPVVDPVAGHRYLNITDKKIYTSNGTDWDAGVSPVDGYALFDRSNETSYVFSGSTWVQFTGTGQITAGLGLSKTGNRLDLELSTAGGLTFTPDSVGEASVLALKLATNGGLSQDASGVYIASGDITNAMLAGGIKNSKLVNSSVTVQTDTGSHVVALGDTVHVVGDSNAITTSVDVNGNLVVSARVASDVVAGVASFDSNHFAVNDSGKVSLAASGVEAGSYNLVTVDTYGRVTTGANVTAITTPIATNSLPVRSAVYVDGAGVVQLAKADASATVKAVGFIAANGAIATTGGTLDGFSGLTVGARYFLSTSIAGAITTDVPTSGFVAPVGIAISATQLAINIGSPIQL